VLRLGVPPTLARTLLRMKTSTHSQVVACVPAHPSPAAAAGDRRPGAGVKVVTVRPPTRQGRCASLRDGDAVQIVVIDPHAGYARAVRELLPYATLAVDHVHLVLLANRAVTAVRQRVTRELLARRGRATDPPWANRRLLLRARERLCTRALARMCNGCIDHDPTGQILTAWIAKEELRALCALAARGGDPGEIRRPLCRFYAWCADAQIPELTTLAETIETWWPAVLVFLQTGLTNARTEGTNRLIKHVKRTACGYRNRANDRRRLRSHCTRRSRRTPAGNR
jgi:transposase